MSSVLVTHCQWFGCDPLWTGTVFSVHSGWWGCPMWMGTILAMLVVIGTSHVNVRIKCLSCSLLMTRMFSHVNWNYLVCPFRVTRMSPVNGNHLSMLVVIGTSHVNVRIKWLRRPSLKRMMSCAGQNHLSRNWWCLGHAMWMWIHWWCLGHTVLL